MNKKTKTDDFKKIEDLLLNADLGSQACEKRILNRIKYKIETGTIPTTTTKKDEYIMKKPYLKLSRVVTIALAALLLGGSTAYATGSLSSILAFFKIGNTEITQYAEGNDSSLSNHQLSLEEIQEGFKGKLFDKEGNEVLYGTETDYYTADGQLIKNFMIKDGQDGNNEYITSTEDFDNQSPSLTLNEVKKSMNQNIILPTYVPEGYAFKEGIVTYEGNGLVATYENDAQDTLVLLASTTKEASSHAATTESISEITLAGIDVFTSGNAAFWTLNDVTYQLYWNEFNTDEIHAIDTAELRKIIESMK